MKKYSGVVLEVFEKSLLLITSDGEFRKVAHPGGIIQPGQKVTCKDYWPNRLYLSAGVSLLVAAALLALVLLPAFDLFQQDEKIAYGYFSFDLNPSLEFAYDQELNVTAVTTFNDEAVLLMEDLEIEGSLYTLLEVLLERSFDLGYYDTNMQGNLMMISYVQSDQNGLSQRLLLQIIQEKMEDFNVEVALSLVEVDWQVRENAALAGISTNKYMIGQALGLTDAEVAVLPETLTLNEVQVLLNKNYPNVEQKIYSPTETQLKEENSAADQKKGPPEHVTQGPPEHANPGPPDSTPSGQDKKTEPGPPEHVTQGPPEHAPGPPDTPPGQDKQSEPGPPGHVNPGAPDGMPPGQSDNQTKTPPGQADGGNPKASNPGQGNNDKE